MDKNKIHKLLDKIENACASNLPADSLEKIASMNVNEIRKELAKPDAGFPESTTLRNKLISEMR
jgi:hypothetical protein